MSEASRLTLKKYHQTRRLRHQHQRTCACEPFPRDGQSRSSSCSYSYSWGCQRAKAVRADCPSLVAFCRRLLRHDLALDPGPRRGLGLASRLLRLKGSLFVSENSLDMYPLLCLGSRPWPTHVVAGSGLTAATTILL